MAHPCLTLLCTVGIVTVFAWSSARSERLSSQDAQPQASFSSKVDLVKVAVVVVDRERRFVPGLAKEDFVLFEDGRRQEIESFNSDRTPLSLGILVDATANGLTARRWSFANAVMNGLFKRLAADDELFVAQFSDRPRMLQTWTSDRAALQRGIDQIRAGADRALFDAVDRMLIVAGTGHRSRKALLIISDGYNNYGTTLERTVRDNVRRSDVLVYATALEETAPGFRKANVNALRGLTDSTGGRTEIVQREDQTNEMVERLAVELGQQYLLGYPPPAGPPLRWRDIKVEVRNRKDVTIRARDGYVSN